MSYCSKPGCPNRAALVLGYDYASALVVLEDADGEVSPHAYTLCFLCGDALRPPRGWTLEDRRARPVLFVEQEARLSNA
jgi:hypothetical protein